MAVQRLLGRCLLVMFIFMYAVHQLYDRDYAKLQIEKEIPKWTNQPASYFPYVSDALNLISGVALVGCALVLVGQRLGAWLLFIAMLVIGLTVKNPIWLPGDLQDHGRARLDAVLHWGLVAGLWVAGTTNYGKVKTE